MPPTAETTGRPESGREASRADVVVSVCTMCRGADADANPGAALLAALREAAGDASRVTVREVQCLSVCKRPATVALSGPDHYTYVFGDLDPATAVPALLECARLFAEAEHGYLLWRERPEALRRGIVARIPPPGWLGEDGKHPR
jgi:predicted metal-binding protein